MGKKERTRQLIIEKAAPIFNKKGYSGTSMRDLTEAVGLTKGSIYGNFKNKDEIALAVFDYNVESTLIELTHAIGEKNNAVEKLLLFPEFFKKVFSRNLIKGGCPIVNTAVDSSHIHSELNKKVTLILERWRKLMVAVMEKGKSANEIKPDINSDEYASVFMTLIEGSVMLSSSTSDMKFLDHSFKYMEKIVVAELKK